MEALLAKKRGSVTVRTSARTTAPRPNHGRRLLKRSSFCSRSQSWRMVSDLASSAFLRTSCVWLDARSRSAAISPTRVRVSPILPSMVAPTMCEQACKIRCRLTATPRLFKKGFSDLPVRQGLRIRQSKTSHPCHDKHGASWRAARCPGGDRGMDGPAAAWSPRWPYRRVFIARPPSVPTCRYPHHARS